MDTHQDPYTHAHPQGNPDAPLTCILMFKSAHNRQTGQLSHGLRMCTDTQHTNPDGGVQALKTSPRPPPSRQTPGTRPRYPLSSRPRSGTGAIPRRDARRFPRQRRPQPHPNAGQSAASPSPLGRLPHRLRGLQPGCDLISLIYRSGSPQPRPAFPTCPRAPAPLPLFPGSQPHPRAGEGKQAGSWGDRGCRTLGAEGIRL